MNPGGIVPTPLYVVTAFRYGWTDYDVFGIFEGPFLGEAVAVAVDYHRRRGGKYAVLVEGPAGSLYISSSYEEDSPRPKGA